jgi:hypothetical protein
MTEGFGTFRHAGGQIQQVHPFTNAVLHDRLTQGSSGKPSGAETIGLWLIADRELQCFSEHLKSCHPKAKRDTRYRYCSLLLRSSSLAARSDTVVHLYCAPGLFSFRSKHSEIWRTHTDNDLDTNCETSAAAVPPEWPRKPL